MAKKRNGVVCCGSSVFCVEFGDVFFLVLTTSVPGMWQTDTFCLYFFVWILGETYPLDNMAMEY